jgi:replicative DNA helicase Mcm
MPTKNPQNNDSKYSGGTKKTYLSTNDRKIQGYWQEFFKLKRIKKIINTMKGRFPDIRSLLLDFKELNKHYYKLGDAILEEPKLTLFLGVEELLNAFPPDLIEDIEKSIHEEIRPTIRIINIEDFNPIEISKIRTRHLNKMFAIPGRVYKTQGVRSKAIKAVYKCEVCGCCFEIECGDTDVRPEPLACEKSPVGCGKPRGKTRFTFIPEQSTFRDFQIIYLEEGPTASEGQPQRMRVFLWDDLCGVYPCNNAVMNGIVKLRDRSRGRSTDKHAVMETYIHANTVQIESPRRDIEISGDDKRRILEIAHSTDPYKELRESIAPSVYGFEDVKDAIALQEVGGENIILPDGGRKRGNIHIFLIGDPGIAKSQILRCVPHISPIGLFGSGEGASGAGLTFAFKRDEFDGQWTVEMGLLPMCDQGVCCFDELDKTSKADRERLHTALATGVLPFDKAGLHGQMKAEVSLLAGANPEMGRFDPHRMLYEQINLSPSLMSRFDLIFTIKDEPEERRDRAIAEHILKCYTPGEEPEPKHEPEFMRKYFTYIRQNIFPVISKDIHESLIEYYVNMRKRSVGGIRNISPRQLEAMIRLVHSNARIRGSDVVEKCDIERIQKIVMSCLDDICLDEDSGVCDLDLISTGYTTSQRDRIWALMDIIKENQGTVGISKKDILQIAEERGIPRVQAEADLDRLRRDGRVYQKYGEKYLIA